MADLRQHLTSDAAAAISAGYARGYPHSGKAIDDHFDLPLASYLRALRAEGHIEAIAGAEGRKIAFVDAWNELADSETDEAGVARALRLLTQQLGHPLVSMALHPRGHPEPGTPDASIEALVAVTNAGVLPWHESARVEPQFDFVSGEQFVVHLEGWRLTLGKPNRNRDLAPLTPFQFDRIHSLDVEIRTGELLAADWFQIDEFTAAVDEGLKGVSLNCEVGQKKYTEAYLRHGLISFGVGNSSPSIFRFDGALVGGWADDSTKAEGYICTDLWRASFIEHERLVEIVGSKVGNDRAREIVKQYLDENDVLRLSVKPGRYHLYFGANAEEFEDNFKSPDLDVGNVKPMFVISDKPLRLDAEVIETRRARP